MITAAPGDVVTPHIAARNRHAVDFSMPEGTSVLAARRGIVVATEWRYGANPDEEVLTHEGNYVMVRHEDGTLATYAHLKREGTAVVPGQAVEAGQLLGYSGETGETLRPLLHFGVSRWEGEAGARYEVSVPVRFTLGTPPIVFEPRTWLVVTATYSREAEWPRTVRDRHLGAWKRPELPPEELPKAWMTLAALALALVGGIVWFWRFSRDA